VGYSSVADVRVLTGATSEMLSDSEVESLIAFSDQQIDDDVGSFSAQAPTRIRHLSSLLTAVKVYSRPDLRQGFHIGDVSVTQDQVEEALDRWEGEIRRIYAFYGKALRDSPSSLGRV